MNNRKIAEAFREIASLLELRGDDPFRIRSYRRAAHNIEGHAQDVAGMADGALRSLSGIGPRTARLLSAVRNPTVGVIAHPTGRLLGERDPYDADMEAVFREASAGAWRPREEGGRLQVTSSTRFPAAACSNGCGRGGNRSHPRRGGTRRSRTGESSGFV